MKLLVTGGAGFIGSNFVRRFLEAHPDAELINLDLLTYAGNLENLAGLDESRARRHTLVRGDVADPDTVGRVMSEGVTHVVNFAAESHVDRSIISARPFIHTNVMGVQVLLDASRAAGVRRFVQVSTDEVYGHLGPEDPPFTEDTPLAPRSPYAASKAAADLLVLAAFETYGLPAVITRCSNNYGPFQFPEKVLPLMISNALEGRPLPVYGDGLNVREWIYVDDHCRALDRVLNDGLPGRVYNIGSGQERTNIDLIRAMLLELAEAAGRPFSAFENLITYVQDRPGHDRRYALDTARIREELGFEARIGLEAGLS
ncbi:MAG: dTDP-glucose 4,6-dehydratase, partial [Proteobacteria bacterium]|nr:dTDP-glucose 4,6-dehydratase [Pseudomonadota bacterium]